MTEKKTGGPVKETALVKKENEQLKGLEESKAAQIKAVFQPMVEMLESFEEKYKGITALKISPDKCKQAKRLRIDIARVRIDADKVRKVQKEEYLRAGQAIQGVYNILKFAVVDKEEKLKDIELHYEKIEEAKIDALREERETELFKYNADLPSGNLGEMEESVWINYINGVRLNDEAIKEAERKAEEERIEAERIDNLHDERKNSILPLWNFVDYNLQEKNFGMFSESAWSDIVKQLEELDKKDKEKQAKIKADNERLRIEAEKAEKKRLADQKKADALRKKQDAILKAARAKQEADQLRADGMLKAEREKREKIEREAAEQLRLRTEDADRKAAEEKKALAAPDKEKLFSVAQKLRNTKTTVKSNQAKKALEDAALLIEKVAEGM